MMNDCWPAASGWALIDYYNLPKNAFYAFKRCSKTMITSIDCNDGIYSIYVINDGERKKIETDIKILLQSEPNRGRGMRPLLFVRWAAA